MFVVNFSDESGAMLHLQEPYVCWLVDANVQPATRIPITHEALHVYNYIIHDANNNIETSWDQEQLQLLKSFTRMDGLIDIQNPQPVEKLEENIQTLVSENVDIELAEEPFVEKEDTQECIEVAEPVQVSEIHDIKLNKPNQKKISRKEETHVNPPNLFARNVIPDPKSVTGSPPIGVETEKVYFDGILNGLRKIRNRALKIDVLMNDLHDCENQGFAVDLAFIPLKAQKENLMLFESEIMQDMQKVIDKCENKMNGKI